MVFRTEDDLYLKLKVLLTSKVLEFRDADVLDVNEEDIWRFCRDNKWKYAHGLRLYEMVMDIISLDVYDMDQYIKLKYN